jgi:hypothetical protein
MYVLKPVLNLSLKGSDELKEEMGRVRMPLEVKPTQA